MSQELEKKETPPVPEVADPRWREAWMMRCRGNPFTEIAQKLGVSVSTAANWYKRFAEIERAKQADFEAEKVSMIGRFEQAAEDSWRAFDGCEDTAKAKSEHMANVLRALQMSARLRGMEATTRSAPAVQVGMTESEVVIRVGGEDMVRRRISKPAGPVAPQAIPVPSREIPSRRRGPDDQGVPVASEGAGRD